ncbi:MAG: hypothetical protein AB7I27_14775 [Bacteriovoracaceae bacterium]
MKIFALFFVSFITFHSAYSKECRTKVGKKIATTLADFEINGELNIADLELFPDGTLVSGYEYDVGPAYTNGLYQRKDYWTLNTKVIPADDALFNENLSTSWSGGPRYSTDIAFYRFFKDPCEAELATPYTLKTMPLKASTIIENKFKVGDYFVYKAAFGIVLSGELLGLISSATWGIDLSANYLMEGEYKVHVVRVDEKHIRLKIVAHRKKGASIGFQLGWREHFEVFSVSRLNKRLERFVNTSPIKVAANKGAAQVVMVDYLLDITDQTIAPVYESILKQVKKFKSISLANPFRGIDELEGNLILDLGPLEDIYREDVENNTISRVNRNIHTTAEQDSSGLELNLGNRIFGFNAKMGNSTSYMTLKAPNDVLDYYLLSAWGTNWDRRVLYSWSRVADDNSLSAVFKSDKDFKTMYPVNLILSDKQKKNRISIKDFEKLKRYLMKALPKEVYSKIPFSDWDQKPWENYNNFGSRFELVVSPQVILEAPQLSADEIYTFYDDHLKSKGLYPKDFFYEIKYGARDQRLTVEEQYRRGLKFSAKYIEMALNRSLGPSDRLKAITKLRLNTIFRATGFSFLMSTRPDMMEKWFHLNLDITTNEKSLIYRYGKHDISLLYKKLLTIKAALDDDGLDILREAESLQFEIQ